MRTETIYNPDTQTEVFQHGDKQPRLTHFTIERSEPLTSSPNPVIQKLIEAGWTVHTTFTFYMALPRNSLTLGTPFVSQERSEFELRVPGKCWLRFRWDEPESVYLTLFYVEYEQQGRGVGEEWLPKLTDALFRAGVEHLWGIVAPAYFRSKWKMNVPRLLRFYARLGFWTDWESCIWKYSPYMDSDDGEDASPGTGAATVWESTALAPVLQS